MQRCQGCTSGEEVSLLDAAPRWALPGGRSASCSSSPSPWQSVASHLPIYLSWCSCVNERRRDTCLLPAVPFPLPPVLCTLQGGLCHLCWQPGSLEPRVFWGGSVPPALSCLCCRIQVGRSHLERAAGNISPCKVSAGDASFLWGHLWQLLHPGVHGGGVEFRQHRQGEGSGLGRCLERSSSSGRFWPHSSTAELPHASLPLAEIKQKSLSLKSLFRLEEWLAPGTQRLGR